MFGAIADVFMQIPKNMHAEEMQTDAQVHSTDQMGYAQAFNKAEAEAAREFNSAQAAESRNWALAMDATKNQRAVADLRTAGLNPILAARQGAGSTPGSSSASGPGATSSGGGSGIASPGQAGQNFSAAQLMEEQRDNLRMDTRKKDAERNLASQHYNESQARTDLVHEQGHTQRHLTNRQRSEAAIAESSAVGHKLEEDINSTTYGTIMRYIDRLYRGSSALRNLKD